MAPAAQVFLWSNATLKPLGGHRPPSRMFQHPHSAGTQSHNTQPNTPSQHRLRRQKVFPLSPTASRWGTGFLGGSFPHLNHCDLPQCDFRPDATLTGDSSNSAIVTLGRSCPLAGPQPLCLFGLTLYWTALHRLAAQQCPVPVRSDTSLNRASCPLARTADLPPSQQQLAPLQTHGQAKPGRK